MRKPTLNGAMVALATPLTESSELDGKNLGALIERSLTRGVTAICPVGSTGEGAHLSRDMRLAVTKETVRIVNGRVPVISGIAISNLEDAKDEAMRLTNAGSTHLLVTPPYFYPLPSKAIEDFYLALAAFSEIPLLLYNIPQFTKNAIAPELVGRLAKHGKIVGIKDSSRDFEYFLSVLAAMPEDCTFSVLTGTDTMLLPSLVMGGDGTIAASANFVPELSVGICDAFRLGDLVTARRLQRDLMRCVLVSRRGAFPAGWKAMLTWLGIGGPNPVAPTPALSESERAEVSKILDGMDAAKRTRALAG